MTRLERLGILWHVIRGHASAYSMNGKLWRCQCGATVGRWTMEL